VPMHATSPAMAAGTPARAPQVSMNLQFQEYMKEYRLTAQLPGFRKDGECCMLGKSLPEASRPAGQTSEFCV
jgi:hypothetical protein